MSKLKSSYIKMRNQPEYDLLWFYKYYCSKVKTSPIGTHIFIPAIRQALTFAGVQIINHLDREFEVTVLLDSQNNEILIF